jgi:hypothetical protein
MKKNNLGVIIGRRDSGEGTIYCTEMCDYLVLEEERKYLVEGMTKGLKKEVDFIPEDEKAFVVGCFKNEKEVLQGIIDFERSQWGKK